MTQLNLSMNRQTHRQRADLGLPRGGECRGRAWGLGAGRRKAAYTRGYTGPPVPHRGACSTCDKA